MRAFIGGILLAVALMPTCVRAVCFEPKIRADDEFFTSFLVFTGTIIRDEKYGQTPDGFYAGHIFTWRVEHVLRGTVKPGESIQTVSGDDSGRFPAEAEEGHQVGRAFLIFASPDPSGKKKFAVDNCGNSIRLSKASLTIAEIKQLTIRHGGLLYGEMFDGDANVRVVAVSAGKRYETVSNVKGKFALRVPPGTYNVTASMPGHAYDDFELAYKRSESVTVPDGGSAGVAFREKGR